MDVAAVDQVRLNFNAQGLLVINAAIGLMMLGVALDLKVEDFKRIFVSPKAPLIGLGAQFILLPLLHISLYAYFTASSFHGIGDDTGGSLSRWKPFQYTDIPGKG